jgi:hypothetical protein
MVNIRVNRQIEILKMNRNSGNNRNLKIEYDPIKNRVIETPKRSIILVGTMANTSARLNSELYKIISRTHEQLIDKKEKTT